ncbi:SdrD B-like domain-containing protein [Paenibacillus sp. MMS18-CY102]|uniref:SdrD B-like domain-containing protein n=1 Tax=Paenibacillus sp. MMS18-CY102 TaxID=2682849 RepID=UPI0013655E91|nr:SdrD B-like domain-containing protein [Paenibacillus sp. MMS18-CY102]
MKLSKPLLMFALIVSLIVNYTWIPLPSAQASAANGVILDLNVNKNSVDSGDTFTYQINFSFSALAIGSTDFSKVKVELPMPAGVEYENSIYPSLISGVTKTGNMLSFSFGPTGPSAGSTYSIQVNAHYTTHTTPEGTSTTTQASVVRDDTVDPALPIWTTLEQSGDATVISHAKAKWKLEKTRVSPEPTPMLGGNVQYEIFLNNEQSGTDHGVLDIENVTITDILPPEAVWVSGGSYDSASHTVSWGAYGSLQDDQRYYVTVNYPAIVPTPVPMPTVDNNAVADFNPIAQGPVQLTANYQHTFIAAPSDLGPGGIHKSVEYREQEISPGQQVHFYIDGIRNRSNTAIDNASIVDMTPKQDTVGTAVPLMLHSVTTPTFQDAGTTYDVYYSLVASPAPSDWILWKAVSATAAETLDATALGDVTGVKYVFNQPLPISFHQTGTLTMLYGLPMSYMATAGQKVENTATFTYDFEGTTKSASSKDAVKLTPDRPLVKLDKSVVSAGPFKPEDVVEFELGVTNTAYTSANFNDPIVIDMLPKEIDYIPSSFSLHSSTGFQGGATLVLDQLTPDFHGTGQTLMRWKFDQAVTMGKNDNFTIRFKAKIKKYTPAIQLVNTAELTSNAHTYFNDYYFDPMATDTDDHDGDSETTDKLITHKAYVAVNKVVQLTSVKQVRGELDSDWQIGDLAHLGNTTAGGRVDYKLTVTNESNINVKEIVVVDALPKVNDEGVIVSDQRGTTWSTVLTAPLDPVPNVTTYYNTTPNVKMETATNWSLTPPADLTMVTGLKFVFDPTFELQPSESVDIEWAMKAPVGTPNFEIAWNSFGYKAKEDTGANIVAAEPPKVGINIQPDTQSSIGDYVWVDINEDGVQNEGAEWGLNGIRVDLLNGAGAPVQKFGKDVFTVTGNDSSNHPGYYLFPNLPNGTYRVRFHLPDGYTDVPFTNWTVVDSPTGTDANDSDVVDEAPVQPTAISPVITLPLGTKDLKWDAGLQPPKGKLGDYVWKDVNGNGINDEAAAQGTNGLTIELYDETGTTLLATDVTKNKGGDPAKPGYYEFDGLLPKKYKIKFPLEDASGNIITFKNRGSDTKLDSNANANGFSDVIDLKLGQINFTIDAGYVQPVSIGDYVWEDLNDNGVQNAGEPAVSGVTVKLLNSSDTVLATTATDATGHYLFNKKLPGQYKIQFTAPVGYAIARINSGADDALDSDASRSTGKTAAYTLNPGDVNLTVDGGLVRLAKLGDRVWSDDNDNGIQDLGEQGVSGVTVKLYDETSALVGTITTDASGLYSFANLTPGRFIVEFTRPSGYLYAAKGAGGDTAADSNANVPALASTITAATDPVTLQSGTENLTIDAGLVKLGSIGNFVWIDSNDNGIQDAAEPGLSGAVVTLVDQTGAPVTQDAYGTAIAPVTTSASGAYLFTNLPAGQYRVKFKLPTGYWFADLNTGADDAVDSDAVTDLTDATVGMTATTALGVGENNLTLDAGALAMPSIGDHVWYDTDGDGVQDAGETGASGITVELVDNADLPVTADALGNTISPVVTDASGNYLFKNLLPGTYKVKFSGLPTGYEFTETGNGTAANDSNANQTTGISGPVTIAWHQQDLTIDAGIVTRTSIGDYVWFDANDNGVQDGSEAGKAGITVKLYDAANLTAPVATQVTDANGNYLFTNLWPGDYKVEFVLPGDTFVFSSKNSASATAATDSDANPSDGLSDTIHVDSGDVIRTVDAGIVELVSIGDYVWIDANNDGIQTNGETGYAGLTVHLLDSAGAPIMKGGAAVTAVTDANGAYKFDKLVHGTYKVKFDLPAGYLFAGKNKGGSIAADSNVNAATGECDAVVLPSGTHDMTIDAGLVPLASLGDYVWMDYNQDGVQDSTESGINGVTVTLYDSTGTTVVATTATANDGSGVAGYYRFSDLAPGAYKVAFQLPSGYFFTKQIVADPATDSNADAATGLTDVVILAPGENNMSVDAGMIKKAKLGNYVWIDQNVIGLQEAGELGINGVQVKLMDEAGTVVGTQTTADDAAGNPGYYLFIDLKPGKYSVQFILPTGYLFTNEAIAAASADTDSNVNTNGVTEQVTLQPGEENLSIDTGVVVPAAVGNYVWKDQNGNGIQEATELGVNDVAVNLLDENGNVISTTTTANDPAGNAGYYAFTNLIPGTYQIEMNAPAGQMFVYKHAGTDRTKDSDVGNDGKSDNIILLPGENNVDIDAGIQPIPPVVRATVGDYVWIDLNNDGVQDDSEHGLNGVEVKLINKYGASIATFVTKNDSHGKPGYYLFDDLLPDTYSIKVMVPSGYTVTSKSTSADKGKDSDIDANGVSEQVTLQPAQIRLDLDAGLVPLASLGNYVWIDKDKDGIQDAGELGLNGVTVILHNASGAEVATAITANSNSGQAGYYGFKDLLPGQYSVTFIIPSSYLVTKQEAGSSRANDSNIDKRGETKSIVLQPGESNETIDAGFYLKDPAVPATPDGGTDTGTDNGTDLGTDNGTDPGNGEGSNGGGSNGGHTGSKPDSSSGTGANGNGNQGKPNGQPNSNSSNSSTGNGTNTQQPGTPQGTSTGSKGNNGKEGGGTLPQTGEAMPFLPTVGYMLTAAALLLLSTRRYLKNKMTK